MQDNDPISSSAGDSAPPHPLMAYGPEPAGVIPRPGGGPGRLILIIVAVMVVVGGGFAAWKYLPQPKPPEPPAAATFDLIEAEASLGPIDEAFDDLDLNMTSIEPSLLDVQGNLNE